ncbi:MAG: hypothetical protein KDK60_01805 [Chlamydiia bacterium]|nr:hypothetical protein [Chlamydiia bacterium]
MTRQKLSIPVDAEVYFVGPPLEKGPLPTLFYFALSAKDSLSLDPFNQPVQFLKGKPLRIFSITLPSHENNRPPEKAVDAWADRMAQGEKVIPPFIEKVKAIITHLRPHFEKGTCDVMGLSRGAFIACHVAALCPEVTHILGYAPLTKLTHNPRFKNDSLNLIHLVPKLYDRTVRFYIGNHDTKVGTDNAFHFIDALSKEANSHRIRSAPIELIIGPSIGYQGHGTPPEIFRAGAEWIAKGALS